MNKPTREIINTDAAPAAIGTYSQAVRVGQTVYISGQIALDPQTAQLQQTSIEAEIEQVFKNLSALIRAANASPEQVAKLTLYLVDLAHFGSVNEVMARYFTEPYPARAAVGVASLPKGARFEADTVVVLGD